MLAILMPTKKDHIYQMNSYVKQCAYYIKDTEHYFMSYPY